MDTYLIGGVKIIRREGVVSLVEDKLMLPFLQKEDTSVPEAGVVYESILRPLEGLCQGELLYYNDTSEAYDTDEGRFVVYHWCKCRFGYGFYLNELLEGDHIRCFFDPGMLQQRPLDTITFFSTAGLHSKFLQRGGAVLHSSYVDRQGKAVLFAGPSGVGKSTQAALWERYGGGRIINGDRTLLRQKDGIWYAYGYPCCGSSGICLDESMPIKAIVLLEQGPENRLIQPALWKKVAALMAGMEAFSWEQRETERTFALASQLARQVPVVLLSACPDEQAVRVLDRYLNEI